MPLAERMPVGSSINSRLSKTAKTHRLVHTRPFPPCGRGGDGAGTDAEGRHSGRAPEVLREDERDLGANPA